MSEKHVIKLAAVVKFFKDEEKLISRGESAVEAGHVENMTFDDRLQILRGRVMASMRDRHYNVEIQFNTDWEIEMATCTCPRGQFVCHHMASLALFGHYNVSVTDKACAWIAQKSHHEETKRLTDLFPLKVHRATQRDLTSEEIDIMLERLSLFEGAVGFTWLLSQEPKKEDYLVVNVEDVLLCQQYLDATNKEDYLLETFQITEEVRTSVATATVGQHKNDKWLLYRKNRLTASNFGVVLAACRRRRFPSSLFKRLAGSYDLDHVKAVQWGRENEAAGIAAFETALNKTVEPTGLWLHICGFLGASPDGFVNTNAIVEIKCPYKYREADLMDGIRQNHDYIIMADNAGNISVNKYHEYYLQIQGILAITQRELAYLVIWTPKEVVIVQIEAEDFTTELTILKNFYLQQYVLFLTGQKYCDG